ncbi:Voltage-dependent anion channel domain containing protein [Naviculisporaceae sp. PSN 640]
MLSLSKRYAIYIPTTPRPSSKIFEFFGISPSASPTSSLRQLLSGQGTGGRSTPRDAVSLDIDRHDGPDHAREHKGWSHTEAYRELEEAMGERCKRSFKEFVRSFGAIWFLIPINAGLIGLLLRQILIHVLIPSDLVHATTNGSFVPSGPADGHGIQIKVSLRTNQPFRGQRALQTTSTIFFFIDLVCFTLFSFLLILRLVWFKRTAWREVLGLEVPSKPQHSPYMLPVPEEATRFARHAPKNKSSRSRESPVGELSLWPLAWLTLVAFPVAIIPETEESEPLARNLISAAYISWWIGAVWSILATLLTLGMVIVAGRDSDPVGSESKTSIELRNSRTRALPSNLLFLPIALSTVALVGPLLVSDMLIPSPSPLETKGTESGTYTHLSRSAILPVLVLSFCALGASLFLLATIFPTLLFTHLFSSPFPHRNHGHEQNEPTEGVEPHRYGLPRTGTPIYVPRARKRHTAAFAASRTSTPPNNPPNSSQEFKTIKPITTTVFYLLAAISQSTAAIQLLGSSLSPIPGGDQASRSTASPTAGAGVAFLTDTSPSAALSVPCVLLALLLLGISALWFFLALVCVMFLAIKKQLWWDMAFGHGTVLSLAMMGLSSVILAGALNSGFFRVVACVFLGVVVVGFCVNIGFTIWFVVTGRYMYKEQT